MSIVLPIEPVVLETATNDTERVSQYEISDDNTQPLLDLLVSISFHEEHNIPVLTKLSLYCYPLIQHTIILRR